MKWREREMMMMVKHVEEAHICSDGVWCCLFSFPPSVSRAHRALLVFFIWFTHYDDGSKPHWLDSLKSIARRSYPFQTERFCSYDVRSFVCFFLFFVPSLIVETLIDCCSFFLSTSLLMLLLLLSILMGPQENRLWTKKRNRTNSNISLGLFQLARPMNRRGNFKPPLFLLLLLLAENENE